MNDDRDRDIQDWFERSAEAEPREPFTQTVLEKVRRSESRLRLQHYAALLAAFFSFCLLLPELIAPLEMLAALPLALVAIGDEHWPLLVLTIMALAYALIRRARDAGILRGR